MFLERCAIAVSCLYRDLYGDGVVVGVVVAMSWVVLRDDFLASFCDEGYVVGFQSCDSSVVVEGEGFSSRASCDASAVGDLEQVLQRRGDRGAQRCFEKVGEEASAEVSERLPCVLATRCEREEGFFQRPYACVDDLLRLALLEQRAMAFLAFARRLGEWLLELLERLSGFLRAFLQLLRCCCEL